MPCAFPCRTTLEELGLGIKSGYFDRIQRALAAIRITPELTIKKGSCSIFAYIVHHNSLTKSNYRLRKAESDRRCPLKFSSDSDLLGQKTRRTLRARPIATTRHGYGPLLYYGPGIARALDGMHSPFSAALTAARRVRLGRRVAQGFPGAVTVLHAVP